MSSSRSDVVTKSVRVSVPFFLLVSLKFILVLESFNGVSRKFKGYLKLKVCSWKFQGCFKEVLRVFQGSFKRVSRKFQECFKEVSGKFQKCFRKFQGCFN